MYTISITRVNYTRDERVEESDAKIIELFRVQNDRRYAIRMMFLMMPYGIFKRDKSQRRLVNHKGVDMCINVGRGTMMKGVWKREETVPTLTLYCGMNGTLLQRLPYRRWLAKIFITLWTVIGTPYSIPLWKIVSAFTGANHILFASRFFLKLEARIVLCNRVKDMR